MSSTKATWVEPTFPSTTAGDCEHPGCHEGAIIWLNGEELLCWKHYCEVIRKTDKPN